MLTRICTRCGKEKPLSEFYRNKKGKYGRDSRCKCCKEEQRRELKRKRKEQDNTPLPKVPNLEGEIWRNINGYEGLYAISNLGRVKSLERYRKTKKIGRTQIGYVQKEKILSQKLLTQKSKAEYYQVSLCKNGKLKMFSVHRLVATAFIENPSNKPYVNHKDGNGLNNNVKNLEWTTNRENQRHAVNVLKHSNNKPIVAFDKMTMEKQLEFEVMSDAARWLLENNKTKDKTCLTGIIKCCKNKIPSYLGYIWRYKEEVVE